MPTDTVKTCMHGTPEYEICDPCKTMDLFRPRREPVDLPASLVDLIEKACALESDLHVLAKGLVYRAQGPAEVVGDLNIASKQVKCARLFLQASLQSVREGK
jgi:hypothetical protein